MYFLFLLLLSIKVKTMFSRAVAGGSRKKMLGAGAAASKHDGSETMVDGTGIYLVC